MFMDIEDAMRFILDTQARLEASVQIHDERFARLEGLVESNSSRIGQLVDVCLSLARHAEDTDRRMAAGFKELRELQAASECRLNALIDTVDKLVRRNGSQAGLT